MNLSVGKQIKLNQSHNSLNQIRLTITKNELGKGREGNGCGVEIAVMGLTGNPQDSGKSGSIWLEYYEGKVQLHVWTDGRQDPQTIILT